MRPSLTVLVLKVVSITGPEKNEGRRGNTAHEAEGRKERGNWTLCSFLRRILPLKGARNIDKWEA